MTTNFKIALAVVAGAAMGAAAMQGLYAQAKPKAYSVADIEVLDPAALEVYFPLIVAAVMLVAAASTLPGEGQSHSRARLPSGWPSSSGTAWNRRRPSSAQRPSETLRRSATRR